MNLYTEISKVFRRVTLDGGDGSGNWGHKGRKGEVGGSGEGGGFVGYLDSITSSEDHSISKYIKNGKLSNKRRQLHHKIANDFFSGVEITDNPTIYFNGGGSASGKSTATESGLFGDVPTLKNKRGICIDPDEIKTKIPEYQQMVESGDPNAAAYAHEESSALAKLIQQRSIKSGKFDTLIDGTLGGSTEKVKKKILDAKKTGQPVVGNFVTVDIDEALKRNYIRYLQTGRKPKEEELIRNHKQVSKNFPEVAPLFDKCTLVDNNSTPKKIAETKNGEIIIYDKKAYNQFIEKQNRSDNEILHEFAKRIPEIKKEFYEKNKK